MRRLLFLVIAALTALGIPALAQQSGSVAPTASAAIESNNPLKATDGASLFSLTVVIGATSGYVLLFDATSAPADGAVTPKWFFPIKSDGTSGGGTFSWTPALAFSKGVVAVFSTTGPFTKTASATAAFSAQVR